MVEDRVTDGRRIAELLASEVDGREDGELARFAVENADRDVEPTDDGARAYDVYRDGDRIGRTFVHPDRVRLELAVDADAIGDEGVDDADAGLSVRSDGPSTTVVVARGAAVKRATDVLEVASRSLGRNGQF
ncbi:hypothetical protein [Natrialbaceae archaeon AArc-T1-2]|uniref:hypothetical protein n=1 Tax=Natrialbaceae archaeon AArc-T1-2 TaxID=3053904 RepID=UPI00255B3934|nr:hypothetical protein [Natrialbaceae archaeon AArc-T1-2]WIV67606.1 hypothetical protein QQ977_02420 [Natrialbaceae archaeon AArc-T1-2]